jgi:G3E family GTPase
MAQDKIPVTVLTGFLGAGKTTLLNRILTENHGRRIAVIENEFGQIGVDQKLVIRAEEEIYEMSNGCICCTVRGDLIRILQQILRRKDRFERVLVETTGLADPAPVAQTFFADEELQARYKLDGIVTVVDAKHLALHVDDSRECVEQIAFADALLLNKADLVTPDELRSVEHRVRAINPFAPIHPTTLAQAPIEALLDLGGFDLERALEKMPEFLAQARAQEEEAHACHDPHCTHHHHAKPQTPARHNPEVGAVALTFPGALSPDLLNAWMQMTLQGFGQDIFRMKGLLHLQGSPNQLIFQGVHMQLEARDGKPWPEGERVNQIVFLGRKLDAGFLERGLKSCLAPA